VSFQVTRRKSYGYALWLDDAKAEYEGEIVVPDDLFTRRRMPGWRSRVATSVAEQSTNNQHIINKLIGGNSCEQPFGV
jgi:hypothetical protein